MASKRTYEFRILAKIDEAIAAVNRFSERTQKRLDGINFNTAISAIRDGFEIIRGVADAVFGNIARAINASVAEAQEAEDANIALANSLRLMGDLSEDALRRFDDLGQAIQSTTKFTADMVKGSVAVAKQFRLTNEETERVIKVATDLAAAQGITLTEATRKVSQTFNGFVDKDLAKVIPGLKNLGLASLVAGDAVELIGERVRGTAQVFGNTFAGALFRAQEAFNDILETLGNLVIQNPAIIAGINKLQEGFKGINRFLQDNSKLLRDVVTDGFLLFIQAAPGLIETIKRVSSNLDFLFLNAQKAALIIAQGPTAILQGITGNSEFIDLLGRKLDELNEKFGARQNAREDFFDPLIEKTKQLVANTTKAVEAARDLAPAYERMGNAADSSLSGVEQRMAELSEQFEKQVEQISREPVKVGFDLFITRKVEVTKNDAIALGTGVINSILKGAEGARDLVSDLIGSVANAIVPGIGGVVSEIVNVLSQGPEKTREMVEGFARAIPQIVDGLIRSLPVLIETLARELPPALAKTLPFIAERFTLELVKNIPKIIRGFIDGLVQAAKDFVQAIIDFFKDSFKSGFGLFGGGDGGGGILGDIVGGIGDFIGGVGDFLGFAQGGRTKRDPRLANDRGLVRVGPNEQFFSGDLTDRMERMLEDHEAGRLGGGPSEVRVQMVLNRRVLAEEIFQIRRAGYRQ